MVVSQTFPPLVGGTANLLANLLHSYPGDVVAVAGYSHYRAEDPTFATPCRTVYLRPPRVRLLELMYDRLLALACQRKFIYYFIKLQVRRFQPDVIMSASPGVGFFVSAFRVAQDLGIPFYAHMHDLWQENYKPGDFLKRRELADRWERSVLTRARRVLCMTVAQQDFYSRKYGICTDMLPHTIPPEELAAAPRQIHDPARTRRTVLFVGALSREMNADALRVVARAADLLPANSDLLFCTNATLNDLSREGIRCERLRVLWTSREEVRKLERASEVLIAPLSHKNCSADEVRTVFSTKLLEYLISGRPIVVFAPSDCFHARSARDGNWGYVVDRDDPEALADGIIKVMEDRELAASLVAGALEEGRRRDARVHATRLHEWVTCDTDYA